MTLVHIINSLSPHGTEYFLKSLLSSFQFNSILITLRRTQPTLMVGDSLHGTVYHICLGTYSIRKILVQLLGLQKRLTQKPRALITWLYYSDLLGLFIYLICFRRIKLIWNVRNCNTEISSIGVIGFLSVRILAIFSTLPTAIVFSSHAARCSHERIGYRNKNMIVIPPGVDTSVFKYNDEFRDQVRDRYGILNHEHLLGSVGRWDPQKDHSTFFKSLSLLVQKGFNFKFMPIGAGCDYRNYEFMRSLYIYDLLDKVVVVGEVSDILPYYSAFDLFVMHSKSESSPNALLEALSCSCVCISTDVGDARQYIWDSNFIVPHSSPVLLAKAIERVFINSNNTHFYTETKDEWGRNHIKERFERSKCMNHFYQLFTEI